MGTNVGETRLLAHVETLVRPIQWWTFGSRSISSFFFSVEFWQQLGRVAALTLNSSTTDCRIMTPEVLWLLFFLFLLKIICLLLHATGQISNFKTKKQQGQDFPPSQPFLPLPIQETLQETSERDSTDTKSTSQYIVCHGRITKNFPQRKVLIYKRKRV